MRCTAQSQIAVHTGSYGQMISNIVHIISET
jgi:hypothetical protein